MTVTPSSSAAKDISPLSLGQRVVRFKTSQSDRLFTVHEDLICSTSGVFKKLLQEHRKPIEGECSICHEDLDPEEKDVTFCRGECGMNMHTDCIDGWIQRPSQSLTCPLCRGTWVQEKDEVISAPFEFNPEAVKIYIGWLYSSTLLVANDDSRGRKLIAMFILADAVEDKKLKSDIIDRFLSAKSIQRRLAVKHAYSGDAPVSIGLRRLLVDLVLALAGPGWFGKCARSYPPLFVHDLADTLLERLGTRPTVAEIKAEYVEAEGNYE